MNDHRYNIFYQHYSTSHYPGLYITIHFFTKKNVESVEGLQSCDGAAQNESVDVVCSLVCVDCLQIHHVTDHMILVTHTIPYESRVQ